MHPETHYCLCCPKYGSNLCDGACRAINNPPEQMSRYYTSGTPIEQERKYSCRADTAENHTKR